MPNKKLIIVHGMGQHTAASFKKEFLDACGEAFELYDSLKGVPPDTMFDVVSISYNEIFDKFRQGLADRAKPIAQRLGGIDGSLPIAQKIVARLVGIESAIADDDVFKTHWLDVLLYRFTMLSELARLKLAEAIAQHIAAAGSANVHVLGHSLGTAVVHDALAKAYGPDQLRDDKGKDLTLRTTDQRLGSVHMVANVSRVLETFIDVSASIVRPGDLGCTSNFFEYRHRLDPIPQVRSFNPTDNGSWVDHNTFRRAYKLSTLTSVTQANTHAIGHYVLNPLVHLPLFGFLFGFRPKKTEIETGSNRFFQRTVEGKAKRLEEAFGDFRPADPDSLKELMAAAQALKQLAASFGEKF